MEKRIRGIVPAVIATTLAAFLLLAAGFAAQQAVPPQAAKQMVPDNPSEHTPPVQPIPYSHKKHLSLGLDCKDCHTNPEPGKLMTFPDTSKCMLCHVRVAKDKPSIQKLAGYSKSKQAIPWVRVYAVLPGVAWNHRPHLEAGVKCETCHGQVREMEAMSEVTSVTTMYSCLHCHEMNHAKIACDTCHKH
ncbi:MAG TPA: cytochrome c3 family protein [Candidatus Acidoferrum sp.]|nr:cytochrome c3 family protein [Candidatus Acidoferrum sp.]